MTRSTDERTAASGDSRSPVASCAVLLAAGRGERLRPMTDELPKALVEVRGEPLVDYHLDAMARAGIREVVVVVGYRSQQVRDHLDLRSVGPKVRFVEQSPPRGTGDAVARAFPSVTSDPFVVGYADVYWGPETRIYESLTSDASPKIAAARVDDASAYGRLITQRDAEVDWLRGIREKDGVGSPALVNAGAYLLPRRVGELLDEVAVSPRGELELTDALTAYVAEGGRIRVVVGERWTDVGTLDRWRKANGPVAPPATPAPSPAPGGVAG